MTNTFRVTEKNLNIDPEYDPDAPMSEKQAARLRELCEKLDEPFDTALNQRQTEERIRQLEKRAED
jgi:hypothetical protein